MAISGAESRYGLPFPLNTDVPDMEAYGRAIAERIAAIELGQRDLFQAGVLISTDWEMTANIVGGTGELGSVANTGGTAWLPDPVLAGSLMRSVAAPAKLSALKPPALPVSTKFMSVGVQLTPSKWGAAPTVSLVSGVEQASEALALTNPAAAVAGKVRIRDVVILNTAGVFSIAAQRDRRPWARGALSQRVLAAGLETSSATGVVVPELTTRIEASGVPLRLTLSGTYLNLEAPSKAVITIAGATTTTFTVRLFTQTTLAIGAALVDGSFVAVPAAGSQLVTVTLFAAVAGKAVELSKGTELLVEELRPSANNGTS
ncbi:MAG TPA: hypothetical protein VH061_07815 [Solirubrobacteraceae bacterium]|jgi:hypothetical protein|nr:hypothetical protein [Solirubrobacteraceae bacterium]